MKKETCIRLMLMLLINLCLGFTITGQTTIRGKVTDTAGETLIGVNVFIKGTGVGDYTDVEGNYSLTTTKPFPLVLEFSYTGYAAQEIEVTSAGPIDVQLEEGITLEQVVVSVSRRKEKIQEAPASISVVGDRQLETSPQVEPVRNLVNLPGVQIQQQSAARINIEMRASASIFSTEVFPIMDYRSLIAPGTGAFTSDAAGINNIDLAQIEVVRGPGSALYGPGVTAGVVHFITKNPIDYPGTTVQVGYGELNTLTTALRHAWSNASKKFGYKITAAYNQGDEFTLDGSEGTTDGNGIFTRQLDKFQSQIIRPEVTNSMVDLTKPGEVLLTREDLDPDGNGNLMQEDWENMSMAAHLEFRPQNDLTINLSGGYNSASAVFYNDLGEGLSQSKEYWTQARLQKGGLFAQVFFVDNDGGKDDRPTFLYQSGNKSSVARQQLEGQLQYSFQTPSVLEAEWTIGADYRQAFSDTGNLTYGRNEDKDDYTIYGGYIQGKFALGKKFDLIAAGRYDQFNFLDEGFFSPRLGLVYKHSPTHTFRATYNRAGSPPPGLDMNIDFAVAAPAPGVFDFWLTGANEIQEFADNPMIEFLNQRVVAAGIADALGNPSLLPLLNTLADGLPDELSAQLLGAAGLPMNLVHGTATQAVLAQLAGSPLAGPAADYLASVTPTGSLGTFFGVNAFSGNSPLNELIPTTEPTITVNNTYEVGYKGLIKDKLGVTLDVYRIELSGFSDFTQIAPLVSLIGQEAGLTTLNGIAADFGAWLIDQGVNPAQAQALAGAYGTVANAVPNFYGTGSVETNRMPQGDGILHVPTGFRYFPDAKLNYYGADLGLEYYAREDLSVWFNYSWVSKTEFEGEDIGESADSPLSYFLNAPKNKFRTGVNYTPVKGFKGSISFQHDDSFNSNNGQFAGATDVKNLVDASVGYNFGNGLSVDIIGNNILDNEYRAFVNMPKIGRRVIGKVTYTFGGD